MLNQFSARQVVQNITYHPQTNQLSFDGNLFNARRVRYNQVDNSYILSDGSFEFYTQAEGVWYDRKFLQSIIGDVPVVFPEGLLID